MWGAPSHLLIVLVGIIELYMEDLYVSCGPGADLAVGRVGLVVRVGVHETHCCALYGIGKLLLEVLSDIFLSTPVATCSECYDWTDVTRCWLGR